jgi:hypothetical protein
MLRRARSTRKPDPKYFLWNETETRSIIQYHGHDCTSMISSLPLSTISASSWTVEILKTRGWLVMGIIGSDKPLPLLSYKEKTCWGWGSDEFRIAGGDIHQSDTAWKGWQVGDEGTFTYDPPVRKLRLHYTSSKGSLLKQAQSEQGQQVFEMDLDDIAEPSIYVNVNRPCRIGLRMS